jgi:hypothetical protein
MTDTRRWIIAQLRRIGVDAPVFFLVVSRIWQFVTGPVTLALMAIYFSPEMRGYFYTFSSILALQVFFELSLHVVLINVVSHEWSQLGIDEEGQLTGTDVAKSRLISLLRTSLAWYGAAAVLFVVTCGTCGAVFLSQETVGVSEWLLPWASLVVITGGLLSLQPFTAILEGCDQLAIVNRYRFRQAVSGSLVVWAIIVSGGGLWAAVGSAAVRLCWELHLLCRRYGKFFHSFFDRAPVHRIDWRNEVWPLQWRLALQGVASWAALQMLTPVIFRYQGDIEAGRMGMTWNVLIAIQAATFSWVETRRPKFGQLAATGDSLELDRSFFRQTSISVITLLVGLVAFWTAIAVLNHSTTPFAAKIADLFLGPLPVGVLCVGMVSLQVSCAMSVYVRANKCEPFLVPALILCLGIVVLIPYFARTSGTTAAVVAWSSAITLFQLPVWTYIWRQSRNQWRIQSNSKIA